MAAQDVTNGQPELVASALSSHMQVRTLVTY